MKYPPALISALFVFTLSACSHTQNSPSDMEKITFQLAVDPLASPKYTQSNPPPGNSAAVGLRHMLLNMPLSEARRTPIPDSSSIAFRNEFFRNVGLWCRGDDFSEINKLVGRTVTMRSWANDKDFISCAHAGVKIDRSFRTPLVSFTELYMGYAGYNSNKASYLDTVNYAIHYRFLPAVDEPRLAQITIFTHTKWFENVYAAMQERFGRPHSEEVNSYSNAFGQKTEGILAIWNLDGARIIASEIVGTKRQAMIIMETNEVSQHKEKAKKNDIERRAATF